MFPAREQKAWLPVPLTGSLVPRSHTALIVLFGLERLLARQHASSASNRLPPHVPPRQRARVRSCPTDRGLAPRRVPAGRWHAPPPSTSDRRSARRAQ